MFELAILTVFPATVVFAGAMDLFTMTIPNRISLGMMIGFVLLGPLAGLGLGDMASHAAAGLLVLAIGVLLFIPGWIGGGDAKLAAAVALWLGFGNLTNYLLCVALMGGSLTMMLVVMRHYPLPAFICTQPWAVRLHDHRSGVPYGIALAAGALMIYPHTSWFASAIG